MRLPMCLAFLALAFPAFAEPPQLPLPFIEATHVYVSTGPTRLYGAGDGSLPPPYNAIYVITHVPTPYGPQQAGVFNTADLKPFGVAPDAKAVFLSGLLIITHGTTAETSDMQVVFRAPGDTATTCDMVMGQVVEASVGNGQRSTFATWVPVVNGTVEFCYRLMANGLPDTGTYPLHSAYGINLSLQAWVR